MWLTKRWSRSRGLAVVMAGLAVILGISGTGCSGDAATSPESRAKAQEVVRKKFDDSADKARGKNPR